MLTNKLFLNLKKKHKQTNKSKHILTCISGKNGQNKNKNTHVSEKISNPTLDFVCDLKDCI